MTDNIYAPPTSDLSHPFSVEAPFYVASQKKLIVLFIGTLGLYTIYWFYRNWRNYKSAHPSDQAAQRIWPVPRSIFSVFFVHSLFSKVKDNAPDNAAVAAWDDGTHATILALMLLASNVLSAISDTSIGSIYTDWVSVLLMIPTLFALTKAQRMINASCDDPDGAQNSSFTIANYLWCAVLPGVFILGFAMAYMEGMTKGVAG